MERERELVCRKLRIRKKKGLKRWEHTGDDKIIYTYFIYMYVCVCVTMKLKILLRKIKQNNYAVNNFTFNVNSFYKFMGRVL